MVGGICIVCTSLDANALDAHRAVQAYKSLSRVERARRKSATGTTADGLPVHSLPTLLDDLARLTLNTVHLPDNPDNRFTVATQPTPLQRRAVELLDVDPVKMFPVRVQVE